MPYAPTITPYLDKNPCPRVEVLFRTFAPGTATVTVWRTAGRDRRELRGAVRAPVAGALARIDFEVPFGIDVTYRAEQFDSRGVSLGWTDTASVQLDIAETWLHNPLDPRGAVLVEFRPDAANSISRPAMGSLVRVQGRTAGVWMGSGRSGVTEVRLDVMTRTLEDADKIAAMLGDQNTPLTPVLCFRIGTRDRIRLPKPFYAAVPDIQEQYIDPEVAGAHIAHLMTGSEADPPVPGLFVPLLTRADLDRAYPTRAAMDADNATRIGLDRRYEFAGGGR